MKNRLYGEMMRTAVIIPYYQKKPGILRRAVKSCLSQSETPPPYIIVVDDESPVPASSELDGFSHGPDGNLLIIEQPNAGPGGARNTGLDALPDRCEHVAFLDSDDEWEPFHLQNAMKAFEAGCDFYFSNLFDYSGETTRFGRMEALGTFRPGDHPLIFPGQSLRWFPGDFVDQLIRDFVVMTSTVVIRRDFLGDLRFPVDLKRSGEDHLLWLKVSKSEPKVAFSEEVECRLGRGVNIYEGSGWGTENALQRAVDYCGINSLMRREFARSRDQKSLLSKRLATCRREFIRIFIHDLARRKKIPWVLVMRQLRYEPLTAATFFSETARIIMERISHTREDHNRG